MADRLPRKKKKQVQQRLGRWYPEERLSKAWYVKMWRVLTYVRIVIASENVNIILGGDYIEPYLFDKDEPARHFRFLSMDFGVRPPSSVLMFSDGFWNGV